MAILVIGIGSLTYSVGYNGPIKILELNTDYNSIGIGLRISTAILGIITLIISLKNNPVTKSKSNFSFGVLIGIMGIVLEISMAALVIGIIIVVVLQALSG